MAYTDFSNSNYLRSATITSPTPNIPLTFSAWINPTLTSLSVRRIIEIGQTTVGNTALRLAIDTNNTVQAQSVFAGNQQPASSTDVVPLNEWTHVFARFYSDGTKDCGINGVQSGENLVNNYVSNNINRIGIGISAGSAVTGSASNIGITQAIIWNTALTDEQLLLIYQRINPLLVEPNNIYAYYPLENSATLDITNNRTLTQTGTLINISGITIYDNYDVDTVKSALQKTVAYTLNRSYANATKTQWRFSLDGAPYFYIDTDSTNSTPYSNVISSSLTTLEIQLPPTVLITTNQRQMVNGSWTEWSQDYQSTASFSSYDRYFELSGIDNSLAQIISNNS